VSALKLLLVFRLLVFLNLEIKKQIEHVERQREELKSYKSTIEKEI